MKKIIMGLIIGLMFVSILGQVFAEDMNTETEEKLHLTTPGHKIRLLKLEEQITFKIEQINETITYLEDNNIDFNLEFINLQLDKLETVKEEVAYHLETIDEQEFEYVLEFFVIKKQEALEIIKEIRNYFGETLNEECREQIRTQVEEHKQKREEIKEQYKQQLMSLKEKHNNEVKNKYQKMAQEIKANKEETKDMVNELKNRIREHKQQTMIDVNLIKEEAIANKEQIQEQIRQFKQQMNDLNESINGIANSQANNSQNGQQGGKK